MTDSKLTSGTQWLIDTVYPNFEEFRPILEADPATEYSYETVAFGANQYPVWQHENMSQMFKHKQFNNITPHPAWDLAAGNLMVWTIDKLKEHGFEHKVIPVISWLIDYEENGWQSMHTHDNNCITQIIYMDDTPHIKEDSQPKESGYGAMYVAMAGEGKTVYKSFVSKAGRCILMTGDVLHGVYPVKSVPRRTIIVDYLIIK